MPLENGAAEQPAGDDLHAQLASAFADAEKAPETSTSVDTPAPVVDTTQPKPETQTAGQERDEQGRFKAKAAEATADPAEAAAGAAAAATGEKKPDPAAPPAPDTTATGEAPAHWSAEDKALVAKLPPEHRAAVVDRFKRMEAGFTPKLQRAAALEKDFGEVEQMFAPHRQAMQAGGWTVPGLIKAWAGVEERLQNGQVESVIRDIAKGYGFDLGKIAGAPAAAAAPDPSAAKPGEEAYVDPEIKRLEGELAKITDKLTARERKEAADAERAASEAQTRTMNELQQFADAKGEDGQPSHPYFAEAMPGMLALAQAARAAGQTPPPLKDLYDNAVWSNPETRARQLAAQAAAEQKKREAEERTRAEKAQKAGSSVSGAPGGAAHTSAPIGIRENIVAQMG